MGIQFFIGALTKIETPDQLETKELNKVLNKVLKKILCFLAKEEENGNPEFTVR